MNIKHEIKVGAFLLASIAILIFTAMWLNDFEIGKNLHIVARFKDAGIISKGTKVIFRGVTAGTVEDVDISSDQKYALVNLRISNKKLKLPKGSTATIIDKGFTGTKILSINPQDETANNKELLQNGDIIEGKKSFNFEELQKLLTRKSQDGTLEKLIDNTSGLTEKLNMILPSIDDLTTNNNLAKIETLIDKAIVLTSNLNITSVSINRFLNSNSFSSDLKETFKSTRTVMDSLNNVADKTNNLIDKSNQTINNFDNVINETNDTLNSPQDSLKETIGKASYILTDVKEFTGNKDLSQDVKSFVGESYSTINRLNCFMTELSSTGSKRFLIPRFVFGSPGKSMGRCTK